jgi:hypothetical protein
VEHCDAHEEIQLGEKATSIQDLQRLPNPRRVQARW